MALPIQLVVGEFQLIEVDDRVHPMRAWTGRVWVDVETSGRTLLFKASYPHGVLILVTILVHRSHVHEQNVHRVGIQIKQLDF